MQVVVPPYIRKLGKIFAEVAYEFQCPGNNLHSLQWSLL